ncbi:hypothetical protein [Paracoccus litorisediminis]|uniref:Uncharacterized protein n=1 Tax=Paracoccus litorisediminis TaxID=2006130 RepID=A0A844HSQ1_9RHOB|nr:hypothetical protein [Paracoccus litorisediminis]MTH62118.1 hypothetical protein [Paracoccus litorisediminis]
MISLKRGVSLRLALKFTPEEWADLEPLDYATATFKARNGRGFSLEADLEPVAQCLYVRAETEEWPVGKGSLDIRLIGSGINAALPELADIPLIVL